MSLFSTKTQSSKSVTSTAASFESLESRAMMSATPVHLPATQGLDQKQALQVALNNNAGHVKFVAPVSNGAVTNTFLPVKLVPIKLIPIILPIKIPFPVKFVEPQVDSAVTSWKDYSKNPLFNGGTPSPKDVAQGQTGDCWYLATLSEVAIHDPGLIEKDITQRSDGTYDVYFHNTNGTTTDIHVDGELPLNGGGGLEYAKLGQGGCTWVPIMEKAFTYYHNAAGGPCYTNISGGNAAGAFAPLGATGIHQVLPGIGTNSTTLFDDVVWGLIFNSSMDVGTNGSTHGPLVNGHEYAVVSARSLNGVNQIELRNPWGFTGPANDGYQWFNASAILPELDEVVFASA